MTARTFFMLLCLTSSISPALALDTSFRPNAAELARLPSFCQAKFTLTPGSPEWNAWRDRIGENFIDIHHYCAALTAVNRYWGARSKSDRGFYLQRALNNFGYMMKAAKPDFALGAELYTDRGDVFKLMGRSGEAASDYKQALSINPSIPKPYLQLAELYVAGKTPARALETVTEGLRHVPGSSALQRRYLELGGKQPFPEPLAAKADEPVPAQPAAPTTAPETTEPAPPPAGSAGAGPAAAAESPPPIGTPKNPYCRFCPPE